MDTIIGGGDMFDTINIVDNHAVWQSQVGRVESLSRVSECWCEWVDMEEFRRCSWFMLQPAGRLHGQVVIASSRQFATRVQVGEFIVEHPTFKLFRCMQVGLCDGTEYYVLRGSF